METMNDGPTQARLVDTPDGAKIKKGIRLVLFGITLLVAGCERQQADAKTMGTTPTNTPTLSPGVREAVETMDAVFEETRQATELIVDHIRVVDTNTPGVYGILVETSGFGGVGVTIKVSVQHSDTPEDDWQVLKELGVPAFTPADMPEWDTRNMPEGTYLIKAEAKGPDDPHWQHPAVTIIEFTVD